MFRLCQDLGASTSWNPQGLFRPVQGFLYLYPWNANEKSGWHTCTTSTSERIEAFWTHTWDKVIQLDILERGCRINQTGSRWRERRPEWGTVTQRIARIKRPPLPRTNTSFKNRSWPSSTWFRVFICCFSFAGILPTDGQTAISHQQCVACACISAGDSLNNCLANPVTCLFEHEVFS